MTDARHAAIAALLLRLMLGVLFLVHASLKIFVFTLPGTAHFFESLGLPAPFAYLDVVGEVGIGICLILGIGTRWVALLGVPILIGTIVTVHGAHGFFFSNQGGGWEYPAVWAILLVVQSLLGDGAAALGPLLVPGRPAQSRAA
jgi:putative oxidoreductase